MNRHPLRRAAAALLAGALSLSTAACARSIKINQILAEPHRYANDPVKVKGTVVRSFSLLGRGAFLIDDGTGTLWVASRHGVPRRGAYVGVKGRVKDAVDLGSIVTLPEPIATGLAMIADEVKAK